MYPNTVLILLGFILGTTLVQYYIFVPKGITNAEEVQHDGYWSPSDGDFDWCEHNYLYSKYIAEPWNSGTSLIYVVVAVLSLHYTSVHVPAHVDVSEIRLMNFILILIGVGSTLFHATLSYRAQLMDEMPMHWLILYASAMLFTRNDYKRKIEDTKSHKTWRKNSRNFYIYALVTVFCVLSTIVVWSTSRDSLLHKITKFLWGFQFVTGFVYCFYEAAKIANRVYDKNPKDPRYKKINRYFDKSFVSMGVALIGWLCDNCYCKMLQNLKIFGLPVPYLHLHAFLWHIGTCIGLHYFLLVLTAHKIVIQYQMEIACTKCLGTLPFLGCAEADVDQKKTK